MRSTRITMILFSEDKSNTTMTQQIFVHYNFPPEYNEYVNYLDTVLFLLFFIYSFNIKYLQVYETQRCHLEPFLYHRQKSVEDFHLLAERKLLLLVHHCDS